MQSRNMGFYEKYTKRFLDVVCALLAMTVFCWLYLVIAILVRLRLGKPVIFKQPRPGIIDKKTGKEKIFYLYKFRTMTEAVDKNGKLLPDRERLGRLGEFLRSTSLDEIPEAFNILKGDMSVIGPRPQLVRDMVFMTDEQRMRHTARPGLSGLAQVNGRNAVSWEEKINWDLEYIKNVTFLGDLKIVFKTVQQVFVSSHKEENREQLDPALDYGDVLLKEGRVSREEYDNLQDYARELLREHKGGK